MTEFDHINAVMVDVSWLAARSFHAYRHQGLSVQIGGRNINTGPLKGFLDAIQYVRSTFNRAIIFLCVDDETGDYTKRDESPEYKTGRVKEDGMFDAIQPGIRAACVLEGVHVVSCPRREADEVIVSLARILNNDGKKSVAFAKDKDMFQALGEMEFCFSKFTKGKPDKVIDREALKERWGVTPEACMMYQAITGDGIDRVQGIPQFWKKYAAEIAMEMPTPKAMKEKKFMKGQKHNLSKAAASKLPKIEENFQLIESNFALTNMFTLSRGDLVLSRPDSGMDILRVYKMNRFMKFLETGLARRW